MNPDYPNSWTTDEVIERLENMVAHYREWPEARILQMDLVIIEEAVTRLKWLGSDPGPT